MKENELGHQIIFLGRFQPFHLGHLSVIEDYLKDGISLEVGIGSAQSGYTSHNPFTYSERKEMLKQITNQILKEMKEPHENSVRCFPLYDQESCQEWINHLREQSFLTKRIITGNEKLISLLLREEYKIIKPKKIYETSATSIREMIQQRDEKWRDYVPKEVEEVIRRINGVERIRNLSNK